MEKTVISHCRYLRTKMAYLADEEDSHMWRTNKSSTANYWCLCTMGAAGPDDNLVVPERCQASRSCYKEIDLV